MKKAMVWILLLSVLSLSAAFAEADSLPAGFRLLNASGDSVDLDGDGTAERVVLESDVDEYDYGPFTL